MYELTDAVPESIKDIPDVEKEMTFEEYVASQEFKIPESAEKLVDNDEYDVHIEVEY